MSKRTVNIGDEFLTNEGYTVFVVEYKNSKNLKVRFKDFDLCDYEVCVSSLYKGKIKNPMHRSVCGVGYIGVGAHKSRENKKLNPAYKDWQSMLERCYKSNHGATVDERWHCFQDFADWYYSYPYKEEGWQLDKDILSHVYVKNYSPETCCYVPKQLNCAISHNLHRSTSYTCGRGELIQGLSLC